MKNKILGLNLILIISLSTLFGCVGTIKKIDEDVTKSKAYTDFGIVFSGIEDSVAVAHNKVDISFFPAGGGSGVFTYVVYRDGNYSVPVASIPGIAANVDAEGKFHLSVGNLLVGTSYTFSVRCFDVVNSVEDINTKSLSVTTLGYEVPVFDGIVALENVGGADGETKLKIRWNLAQPSSPSSDPFGANPNAISGYNVYLGASPNTMILAGSVTNPTTTQFVVTNLIPGTNYFAKVRAKNSATPAQEDLNLKYLQKPTVLSQPIIFNGLKTATIPSSSLGYSRVNLTWEQGSGSFDRYRIFISTAPVSVIDPATTVTTIPDITDLTTTAFTVTTGLSSNTNHYISVVACKGVVCSEFAGHNIVRSIKTTPPVATFNGIQTLVQPSDASGLSSLILTWSAPDTTVGVFNEIRVFKVDNATGVYNPLVDEILAYNAGAASVLGFDAGQTTSTSTIIRGLETGKEYCFIAKAFATSPFDPANPSGRTHTNEKKMCGTPTYASPGFSGLKSVCTAITSSSFTVSWDIPSPLGIFDRYNIWLKPSDADAFVFNDAIAGKAGYLLRLATKERTSLNVTGLSPNTTYRIGARTYFYNPVSAKETYDTNIVVANCATLPAKVEHNGWFEVTSLGRKMDGLSSPPSPIIERMSTPATPYSHTFPEEYSIGSPGVDASDQGMIRIAWEDFSLTGGLGRIYDYPGSTNGYKVYRKLYQSSHEMLPPAVTDNDWGAPINSILVAPKITNVNGVVKYYAEFTDYTVTRPADPKQTKIYWYKVEAVLNNTPIAYNTLPPDGVIRIVLPPDNMSFVHRWMVNKDMCSKMGLPILRGDNYRCAFNGFSSVNGYYDMEHSLLVDRFELACNFTRGYETTKKCTSGSTDFEGAVNSPVNGIVAGDCIGKAALNVATVTAANGAVLYRRDGLCYINTSIGSGTTWTEVGNLQGDNTTNSASILPKNNPFLFPGGTGRGAHYSSNNARLPVLTNISRGAGYHTCAAHEVIHKGTSINKRSLRRKEWVAAASWSDTNPGFANVEAGTVESGIVDRDCNSNTKGGSLTTLNLNDNRYPFNNSSGGMVTGSGGNYSSAACASRYGIQDMPGNFWEKTSEPAMGSYQFGNVRFLGTKFKDIYELNPTDDYLILDRAGLETLKNGTGDYLNFAADPYGQSYDTNFGSGFDKLILNYYSVTLGIPIKCGQNSNAAFYCDNKTDDNTIVTNATSKSPSTITNFNFGGDIINITNYVYTGALIKTWLSGGNWAPTTSSFNGQYTLNISIGISKAGVTTSDRCTAPISN
jgi:hypothetical protein